MQERGIIGIDVIEPIGEIMGADEHRENNFVRLTIFIGLQTNVRPVHFCIEHLVDEDRRQVAVHFGVKADLFKYDART